MDQSLDPAPPPMLSEGLSNPRTPVLLKSWSSCLSDSSSSRAGLDGDPLIPFALSAGLCDAEKFVVVVFASAAFVLIPSDLLEFAESPLFVLALLLPDDVVGFVLVLPLLLLFSRGASSFLALLLLVGFAEELVEA